jgi:hypothetical protein
VPSDDHVHRPAHPRPERADRAKRINPTQPRPDRQQYIKTAHRERDPKGVDRPAKVTQGDGKRAEELERDRNAERHAA